MSGPVVSPASIVIELLSDTTMGSGAGTPGLVDVDVDHDELGLPTIGAKALRGRLRDTWLSAEECFPGLADAAARVLGRSQALDATTVVDLDSARTSGHDPTADDRDALAGWLRHATTRTFDPVSPLDVTEALTVLRAQTATDRTTGAPERGSLRRRRAVDAGLCLRATLTWRRPPEPADVVCLAFCAAATRDLGLARNRGGGLVRLSLDGDWTLTAALAGDALAYTGGVSG